MSRRSSALSVRGATVLVALVAAGCNDAADPPPPARSAAADRPVSSVVSWRPARPATDATPEEVPARLVRTAGSEAVVVAPLPARVVELLVRPGDTVAANAAVARVVIPELDVALATLRASTQALGVLEARRAQLAELRRDNLVRAGEVAELDLRIAEHRADQLRARAVVDGAGLAHGGVVTLSAPLEGVVVEVLATMGEVRRPEDGPLVRVRRRTGQRVEATFPGIPPEGASYALRTPGGTSALSLVSHVPAATGAGHVAWLEAPAGAELPAAADARVLVTMPAAEDGWVLPAAAVGGRSESTHVVARRAADDPARAIEVRVVRVARGEAVVRGPLHGLLVASDAAAAGPEAAP